MSKQRIIGIDMGATKVHVGVVEDGLVVKETKFPTSANAPKAQIIGEIIKGIEPLVDSSILGIGIGAPSLVDEEKGIVYDVQNIPSWDTVYLKDDLENYFKKPVYITNDANIFVLGEKIFGEGKEYKHLVGLTLGTGLGTGVILNNELYSGVLSGAGELGSIPYLDETIEDYCSGKFFLNKIGVEGDKLFAMAKSGDSKALDVYKQFGAHLGSLIKTVLFIFSPEAIVFGGSISKSLPLFQETMHEALQGFPYKSVTDRLKIHTSKTANVALLGASSLVSRRLVQQTGSLR